VFITHAAALILAMHETLLRHGIAAAESHRLIYDIGWSVYRQMGEPPLLIGAAFTRDPRKRLKLATDMFRNFPFGSPSYEWLDFPLAETWGGQLKRKGTIASGAEFCDFRWYPRQLSGSRAPSTPERNQTT